MQVQKSKATFSMNFNDYHFEIKEGQKFLFADDVFRQMPANFRRLFKKVEVKLPPFYRGENLDGRTLLVIAQAAIGDALCMTPALREIKKKYPNMQLWVSISGRARLVLEELNYIDHLLTMPVPYEYVRKADYIVKAVEMVGLPQFDNFNLVEYFLWKLWLNQVEDKTPDVVVDKKIMQELVPIFEEIRKLAPGKKVLLFHYLASSVHRTLPPRLLKEIEDLLEKEYVPVICSLPQEDVVVETSLEAYGIRAANLSSMMKDVRYLIAAVKLSDVVITADTATLHIAAGLKKPTVLISGPIDPDFTASTYPTVIAVRAHYKGDTCVAPCRTHVTTTPCREAQLKREFYSPCLYSIPAGVIVQALHDVEALTEGRFEKPKSCPVCDFQDGFRLFEFINGYPIFECCSCGLQFAYPLRSLEYDDAYQFCARNLLKFSKELPYDNYLDVKDDIYDEISRWMVLPRFKILYFILDVFPRGTLLDVGCSTGFFMLQARTMGYKVYGIEASREACEIARNKFGLEVVSVLTLKSLPSDWPALYNFITALEVLEHLEDPLGFLHQVFERLEKEGVLILSCPPLYKFEHLAKGYLKYKWWGNDYPPNHLTRWKPWTLHYALKKVGFSEVHLFTEPFLSGTLLEGVRPLPMTLKLSSGQNITVPPQVLISHFIETMKPLYLNAPNLGNFQYALAIKGKSPVPNLEEEIRRAIKLAAIECLWGREEDRLSR